MSDRIESFRDLRVYMKACELDLAVFDETKTWPSEEKFALIDQVRRSSRSIGANIAESWAKRRYPAHFVSKLTDADGELQETLHWIGRASAYGYIKKEKATQLEAAYNDLGRSLGKMIWNPKPFLLRAASSKV